MFNFKNGHGSWLSFAEDLCFKRTNVPQLIQADKTTSEEALLCCDSLTIGTILPVLRKILPCMEHICGSLGIKMAPGGG